MACLRVAGRRRILADDFYGRFFHLAAIGGIGFAVELLGLGLLTRLERGSGRRTPEVGQRVGVRGRGPRHDDDLGFSNSDLAAVGFGLGRDGLTQLFSRVGTPLAKVVHWRGGRQRHQRIGQRPAVMSG